jgi:hypothetical protein
VDAVLDREVAVVLDLHDRRRHGDDVGHLAQHLENDPLGHVRRRLVRGPMKIVADGVAAIVGDDRAREEPFGTSRISRLRVMSEVERQPMPCTRPRWESKRIQSPGSKGLELEREPAEDVAERLLEGETDHGGDDRRGREERRHVDVRPSAGRRGRRRVDDGSPGRGRSSRSAPAAGA